MLDLPSEKVADESNFNRVTSLLNLSFSHLLTHYLELHQYPVPADNITIN
jgi:hypothetical protein